MKNLVIVESPAKAKTLEKFLGKGFAVRSSNGHIADLPHSELGINLDNFEANYIIPKEKEKLVENLKSMSDKAEVIWLASDEDREGEAISWHLYQQLNLDAGRTKRIVFNSITKSAVNNAIENPRTINEELVEAQQARRILDRLVGYELSPILWKKIKVGLSAGRVQSVSVRIIVEREREIESAIIKSKFSVFGSFLTSQNRPFKARLKSDFESEKEVNDFLELSKNNNYTIKSLDVKKGYRNPAAPFTTSTLQQEASRKLSFSVSKTMRVAQGLYENGWITYMRTDSVNLSPEALEQIEKTVFDLFGEKYVNRKNYSNKSKNAQEAHEAIRPTTPRQKTIEGDRDQQRLYDLIWKRTLASQMARAELEHTTLGIQSNEHNYIYTAKGEIILFDGFLKLYLEGKDDEDVEQDGILPAMSKGEELTIASLFGIEKFNNPPPRYTEASLVKKLEELGIGRPSTYAPTISTIQNRGYVEKGNKEGIARTLKRFDLRENKITASTFTERHGSNKGKLLPTGIGRIVNDFLVTHFEEVLDYNFTAKVEEDFDNIALGKKNRNQMLKSFYDNFHPKVEHVEKHASRESGERHLGVDPVTKKNIIARLGKYGPLVQLGNKDDDDDDVKYASLTDDLSLEHITLDEALKLFELPKVLGQYKAIDVIVNNGRYGPYVAYDKMYVSLGRDADVFSASMSQVIPLIDDKIKQLTPICEYKKMPVTRGIGRFGPYLKWNDLYISVNKKYDFDNLTDSDISTLIEGKLKKEADKLVKEWPEQNMRIEKQYRNRFVLVKDKKKYPLPNTLDFQSMTIEEAMAYTKKKSKKK